jgi:arylsulfatase A-like enzyme
MNYIIIVGDSLRADRAYDPELMPNLSAFSAKFCTRYDRAYTTAPWTLAAHNGILWGRLPSEVGVMDMGRSDLGDMFSKHRAFLLPKIPRSDGWLPFMLRKAGYHLRWKGGGGYMSGAFGFTSDFHAASQWEWVYLDADGFIGEVEAARQTGRPWFFYTQDYDTHESYGDWPRENRLMKEIFSLRQYRTSGIAGMTFADEDTQARKWYDDSCRQYDAKLGKIFNYLEREGLLDTTTIFFLSDHGESLWEHGVGGHGHQLFEEVLRVPLVAHFPGEQPKIYGGVVSSMDIASTILPRRYAGTDLRNPTRKIAKAEFACKEKFADSANIVLEELRPNLSQWAWVSEAVKVVLSEKKDRIFNAAFYNLLADPTEMTPKTITWTGNKNL